MPKKFEGWEKKDTNKVIHMCDVEITLHSLNFDEILGLSYPSSTSLHMNK